MRYLIGDQHGNMWNGRWGEACSFSASNCRVFLTRKQAEEALEKLAKQQDSDFEWLLNIWTIQCQEEE